MADIDFDDYVDISPSHEIGSTVASAMNWVGALVSLGLVAGVAYWGYELMMRDVNGVPVVRALEGPMRVAPEDPGGRLADHMGLAVNQVTSEGEAAAPADRLVLAPRPVALAESDKPLSELRPVARITPVEAVEETRIEDVAQPLEAITAPVPVVATETAIAAPEPVLTAVAPVVEEPVTPEPAVLTTPSGAKILPASVPGPSRSIRPASRPEQDRFAMAAAAAVAEAMAAKPAAPIEVAAVAAGTNLVQLGAYDSEEIARSEWQRLMGRFGSFFEGKQRLIQKAERGGRTFYRLRAVGFADLADTRRFCAALTAENAGCVPVVAK